MWARSFLAALLLIGQAHAQNIATDPVFSVVQSTAPALDIDFMTGTLDPRVTFSRASNRTCTNSSGTLVNAPHNLLTNSVLAGGTSGTYNAGGTAPTGWGLPQSIGSGTGAGNTTTFAYGTENGVPYMDLGVTIATALGASAPVLLLAPSIVPVVGLTYTAAMDIRLASGSLLAGMTTSLINWWQSVSQPTTSLSGITGTVTRYTQTSVVPATTTAGIPGIQMSVPAGVTGAFTMRIYRPQLEQNSAASTYIPTTTMAFYGPCLDYQNVQNLYFPSSGWATASAPTGAADGVVYTGAVAPDGTTAATYRQVPGTFSSPNHCIFRGWSGGGLNTTYTRSAYYKAAGYNFINFDTDNTSFTTIRVGVFDLRSCSVVSQTDATTNARAWSVGNGWCRVAVTNISNATVGNYIGATWVYPSVPGGAFVGDGVSGVETWGEQVVVGTEPGNYIPTTSAAVTQAQPIGISVEAAATNSLLYSQSIQTSGSWITSVATVTGNAVVAPDGTTTAAGVALTGNGGYVGQTIALAGSVTVTFSAFVKPNASSWIELIPADFGGSGVYVWFNAATCTTGANLPYGAVPPTFVSSTAQTWPNGWCRVSATVTSNASGTGNLGVLVEPTSANSVQGATGNSAYFWGATRELGYAPTSYIATTSSAVTRAADVAFVNVVGIKGINGNTGSLFGQMIYEAPYTTLNYARWLSFNDGNNINIGNEWGNGGSLAYPTQVSAFVNTAGVGSAGGFGGPYSAGSAIRFAQTFNTSLMHVAFNSSSALNNSGSVIPRTITVLNLSQAQRYQGQASLWFQRVTYYPTYLGPNWATGKANGSIP